jgi:16S rRNA (guanine966-N2)-methyltransferase
MRVRHSARTVIPWDIVHILGLDGPLEHGVRIIAGEWRGRTLGAPRGRGVRPTPDRVREALFSILGEEPLEGRVLDLFAGTGALGLEALSRGAPEAVFVEQSRTSLKVLEANIAKVGAEERTHVLARSAFSLRREELAGPPISLVLADPPYELVDLESSRRRVLRMFLSLAASDILAPGARVVLEHRRSADAPEAAEWTPIDRREYGDTALTFYRP